MYIYIYVYTYTYVYLAKWVPSPPGEHTFNVRTS